MRPATPTPHTSQVRRHDRPRQISAGPRRPGRPLAAAALAAAALALLGPLLGHAVAKAQEQHPSVLVSRIDGPITPVVADHLADGVHTAERERHAAFVVELDTPGGLDAAMREIIQAFLGARVPVVVHVTPSGARAASAGALITMAAHVAAMAPGTTIGAATPVDLQGGEISDKVVNDAAAFAEAVARQRSRNLDFAVDTSARAARSPPTRRCASRRSTWSPPTGPRCWRQLTAARSRSAQTRPSSCTPRAPRPSSTSGRRPVSSCTGWPTPTW